MKIIEHAKSYAKKIKRELPVLYLAMKHKDTPWYAKLLALITVGYALSPIDLIPDFIPILGYLDDIILIPLMMTLTIKLIPNAVFESCRVEAVEIWAEGKPKKWRYAIPIVLIWSVVIVSIVTRLLK